MAGVVEHVRTERREPGLGGEPEVALTVEAAGDGSGRKRRVVVAAETPKMSSIVRSQL